MFHTTVLFRDQRDHTKLKVAAAINNVPAGELLDRMVDQQLMQFTKEEAERALEGKPKAKRLLAAW